MAKKYLSEQIEKAVLAAIEASPIHKKIEDALLKVEKRCNEDIQKTIKKMIETYYADYTPSMYQRTYQLKLAVAPYTALIVDANGYSYDLLPNLYEDRDAGGNPIGNPLFLKMDHHRPEIKMTYKKKDGSVSHYVYKLNLPNGESHKWAREEAIAVGLLKNEHGTAPVGGVKGSHNLTKILSDELTNIMENKLPKYIKEELLKIKM